MHHAHPWLDYTIKVSGGSLRIVKAYPNHAWVHGLSDVRDKPTLPEWLGKGTAFLRFIRGHYIGMCVSLTTIDMTVLEQYQYLYCFMLELMHLNFPSRFIRSVLHKPRTVAGSAVWSTFRRFYPTLRRHEEQQQQQQQQTAKAKVRAREQASGRAPPLTKLPGGTASLKENPRLPPTAHRRSRSSDSDSSSGERRARKAERKAEEI